jgi:hypothetical protein
LDVLEKKLLKRGTYIDVWCELPDLSSAGCLALVKGNTYKIEPGQGLKKVE